MRSFFADKKYEIFTMPNQREKFNKLYAVF